MNSYFIGGSSGNCSGLEAHFEVTLPEDSIDCEYVAFLPDVLEEYFSMDFDHYLNRDDERTGSLQMTEDTKSFPFKRLLNYI